MTVESANYAQQIALSAAQLLIATNVMLECTLKEVFVQIVSRAANVKMGLFKIAQIAQVNY